MKTNKNLVIALFAIVSFSIIISGCHKRILPHTKYRGQAPRGPGK